MERESYNIDDILSEVKKRRQEQEKALREQQDVANKQVADDDSEGKDTPPAEETAPYEVEEEKTKFDEVVVSKGSAPQQVSKNKAEDTKEQSEDAPQQTSEDKAEDVKEQSNDTPQEKSKNIQDDIEDIDEDTQEEIDETEDELGDEDIEEDLDANSDQGDDDMVDLLNLPDDFVYNPEPVEEKEKVKFSKTKKGKIIITIIVILVVAIIAFGVFAFYYINNMLNNVTDEDDDTDTYTAVEYYDGMDFLQEDFPIIEEQSAFDVYSYKEYLKYWYQNGDPVSSSRVMNVLLIGEDTRDEEISDTSRADSAIIASINVDTGVINLTSVLRDLYVYYEIDGEGHYGKINEAASNGGMSTYINTIERYYKISIDNYAVVNFASFPKIIDALGGVEVNITTAEINEINNNPYVYGDVGDVWIDKTFDGDEGTMLLDGIQALAFCRIRHIDSDNARADRQKTVITEIISKMKSSGTVDTVKVVNQLSQYTKTGYTKKELISIGNLALRDGWLDFDMQTTTVPTTDNSAGGQTFSVARGTWIWLSDIPLDAYNLQMTIYGKSNIQLNENRPDYISMGR